MSNNTTTSGFLDLASFDELEKHLYGGQRAVAYFNKCVKHSIWFTMVPVVLKTLGGNKGFGGEFEAIISRSGDYLMHTWLRVYIPAITSAAGLAANKTLRWTRNLGHNLIERTQVTFNDLVAHEFDNYWLDFWAAFTVPESKRVGYDNMIGNVPVMNNPRSVDPNKVGPGAVVMTPAMWLNIPLPFFFTRDPGVALPAAAIPYNDMKITFRLRDWNQLLIVDDGALFTSVVAVAADVTGTPTISPANLQVWANYAVVSNDERQAMAHCQRDIAIEQVEEVPRQDFKADTTAYNIYDLRLAHAIKALFWSVRDKYCANEWSNYTADRPAIGPLGVNYYPATAVDPINRMTLTYEGSNRLSEMGSDHFSLVEPWYKGKVIPRETGYHMYSYTMDLTSIDPKGSTNYGKLINVSMSVEPSSQAVTSYLAGHRFDFVLRALNMNLLRISGGAIGFPVL